MTLIALTGKAGSGKDTAAKLLAKGPKGYHRLGYHRLALADPLKDAAAAIFGLSRESMDDPALKEAQVEYWGMSRREMLQQLGDAVREKFGDDVFVKRWELDYNHFNGLNVVVTDCRDDIEADRFRELGGVIVAMMRGVGLTGSTGTHWSEQGLSTPPDFIIDNTGDIAQLESEVQRILKEIR